MAVWHGGRGLKAPYETTHVRIPVAIKDRVEELSRAYKDSLVSGEDKPEEQLSFEEAVETAKEILKAKKSARVSMEKLLSSIYKREIEL